MQFGGLRRFAGRGLEYASKKTLLAAAGWNLLIVTKKMIRETAPNAAIFEFVKPILALLRRILESLCPKWDRGTILARENL